MYLGGSLESKDWQQNVEVCAGPRDGMRELVACNWIFFLKVLNSHI